MLETLKDRGQRLIEEGAFRLWVGAGLVVAALKVVHYVLWPASDEKARARPS